LSQDISDVEHPITFLSKFSQQTIYIGIEKYILVSFFKYIITSDKYYLLSL